MSVALSLQSFFSKYSSSFLNGFSSSFIHRHFRSWTRKRQRTTTCWTLGWRKSNKILKVSFWTAISWPPRMVRKCWNWSRRKTRSISWSRTQYDWPRWGKLYKENWERLKIRKWKWNSRKKFWKVKLVDWKKVMLLHCTVNLYNDSAVRKPKNCLQYILHVFTSLS